MAQPHPNQLAFKEGVEHLFNAWTALKLAVEGEWGGHDTAAKRDWFVDTIVDYYTENGKNVDTFDMEDILLQIMNSEFSITLEDDSEQGVAKDLDQLFQECTKGDYTMVNALKANAQKATAKGKSKKVRSSEGGDDDDDDDSSDDDEDEEEGGDMDVDPVEHVKKEKPEPIIDEDGFETVVKGRRR